MPLIKLPFQTARLESQKGPLSADDLLGTTNQSKENKWQELFEEHGIPTSREKNEFVGNCLFYDCPSFIEQKSDKFTANAQTGQWRCFVCGRNGNAPTFISEVHRNFLEQTTENDLLKLKTLRQHAVDIVDLKEMNLAFNTVTKEWILPAYNVEGKLSNLYMWREAFSPEDGKRYRQIFSSTTFAQLPYGLNRIRHGSQRPIFVLEGHWDYIAMMGLLRRLEMSGLNDIVAAPGAGTFPTRYVKMFNGREVYIMYDNDQAGQRGIDSLIKAMAANHVIPTGLRRLVWPSGLSDKFDVSDVIVKLPVGHRKKATHVTKT